MGQARLLRLRFTPRALIELDGVLNFIASRSSAGACRVQRRLRATFDMLAINPEVGRRTSNGRLRRVVPTPYPYLVFYDVAASEVIIVGVRHAARDPSSMPGA